MEEVTFNEQEDPRVAAKRMALMARLEKRHATTSQPSPAKKLDSELDELIQKAQQEIREKKVTSHTSESLERLLPSTSGRSLKRLQDTLEELRKCALAGAAPKKGFSFARKATAAPKDQKAVESATVAEEPRLAPVVANNAVEISDKSDVTEIVRGDDGSSVSLKNLVRCTLKFAFSPTAVHMKDIDSCTIMFPVVDSSILMHEVKNSRVFAVAQQIRVHDSLNLQLHVAVNGAVILETCRRIHMAPYRLKRAGKLIQETPGEQWKQPRDFDWLGTDASPHWDLLPSAEWIEEEIL